ncbi:Hpt protein [Thiorhodococcus drewsii AZ1]|uniref:Hpt protein n=1 Tax=Thiorhodococcus drewsii AZ1 TaxID=765913 RepID=G2E869_9GAMM|nr:Hpt domain-containing protein [Thiorhodococcus drewsii]EGV27705.1 Hpt protein [Thiorhodococcus drewsii AZ1]
MSTITLDADDQEIIEIFVEEAEEVLQEIDQNLKALKGNPKDRNALGEVRRGFHTLKGSGRMAKAMDLGELAWKMENMLNRALEGKIAIGEPMVTLLAHCHGAMPKLVDDFKRHRPSDMNADIQTMMAQADAIANGEPQAAAAKRPSAAPSGGGNDIQAKLDELQRIVEQSARRSDEALHRAEMGLQQSRKLANQLDTIGAELQGQPAGGIDLKPLFERVNTLTRDVRELRELSRGAQPPAGTPDTRELQHLIDQRIRERTHGKDRSRQELEERLDAVLQAALSARRLGVWALTIGILLMLAAGGTAAYFFL